MFSAHHNSILGAQIKVEAHQSEQGEFFSSLVWWQRHKSTELEFNSLIETDFGTHRSDPRYLGPIKTISITVPIMCIYITIMPTKSFPVQLARLPRCVDLVQLFFFLVFFFFKFSNSFILAILNFPFNLILFWMYPCCEDCDI